MVKNIPYFWLKSFCFIWVLIQVDIKSEESNELNFDIITLGHSGLLITWNPNEVKESSLFIFKCQDISDESINTTSDKIVSEVGQYQISELKENTVYLINITHKKYADSSIINTYSTEERTGRKTNYLPQKPDFKWFKTAKLIPTITIIWLPCGKYRKCNASIPSTHFSIRYRVLESKRWYESFDTYKGYYELEGIFPGKIYEVTVTSINAGLNTASDIDEVFIKPASGPVQDVNVAQISNKKLLISWKPSLNGLYPILYYVISYHKPTNTMGIARFINEEFVVPSTPSLPQNQDNYELNVLSVMWPASEYNIFILPSMFKSGQNFHGIVYSFNYKWHPQNSTLNLPLATPDFRYLRRREYQHYCQTQIQWLPCGRETGCKNARPGLSFKLQVKNNKTGDVTIDQEIKSDLVSDDIKMFKNETYQVTVQSVNGNELSKKVTKIVDWSICKENK